MWDIETRRRIAEELVDAFCEGGWRAEDLAERGAGRLDRRPDWIDALSVEIASLRRVGAGRRAGTELDWGARRTLIGRIERFLRERAPAPDDELAPRLVRDAARWNVTGGITADGGGDGGSRAGPGRRTAPVLHTWPIAVINSVAALAERLELSDGQLAWLADTRGLERTTDRERLRNYRYRWIPRRTGPPRLIEAPKLRLKEVQRWILAEILDHVPAHPAAHGFTRGRSALSHAAAHAGTPAVLGLDLRDFFASVPARRVFGIFHAAGYAPEVAHVLTGLTTNTSAQMIRDATPAGGDPNARFHLARRLATPHLPQGAPTSPALANLAAFGLDRRLAALAAAYELHYSRYADDLTLSGAGLTGSRSRTVSETIARIVRDEGFVLNPAKSRLRTAARRQLVTGIVVNVHPNLARAEYDTLRATLHRLALDDPSAAPAVLGGADLRAHLQGRVAWVESLNPARGAKLRRQFERIDWAAG